MLSEGGGVLGLQAVMGITNCERFPLSNLSCLLRIIVN